MFPRFPVRYLAPNSITGLGIVLACAAIALAHAGRHEWGAWLIVWCVLLDRTDGFVARATNACSEFGEQFDSLADFLCFCVAPPMLVYFFMAGDVRYRQLLERPSYKAILIASGVVYVLSGAVRLARFNVTTAHVGPDRFEGLSSTFAGFITATFLLSGQHYSWPRGVMAAVPLLLFVCSVFMVSNLSLPKSLPSRQGVLFPVLVGLHVVAYGLGILRLFPMVLLILALGYPVVGFSMGARSSRMLKAAGRS